MCSTTQSDQVEAQQRRAAVQLYRAGVSVKNVVRKLNRSRSWVYKWVKYRTQHPWTRFRSGSRAPHHHPNQTPAATERRVLRIRDQLVRRTVPGLRFAGVGARSIQREYRKRYGPPPRLSTIQRILGRNHRTSRAARARKVYRPHPSAEYPNAVQATDIITRWIVGGEVVQTFNTVDVYSNDVGSTTHAHKSAEEAGQHLFYVWKTLGVPDLAQFDNESAFSGGRHPHVIGHVVRLCLYFGIQVLFIPLGEATYNWPVEIFNGLWAKQFWNRHRFSRRRDVPRAQHSFLNWYRTDYIAPRQSDTPARLRRGYRIHRLPARWAENVPDPLPLYAGQIHAVRLVSDTGYVSFLNEPIRVGKRYRGHYVWLTLDPARQGLTVWYQARAEAEWRQLKELDYPLAGPVIPVPKQFVRLHA
jgi:putative transposase